MDMLFLFTMSFIVLSLITGILSWLENGYGYSFVFVIGLILVICLGVIWYSLYCIPSVITTRDYISNYIVDA